MQYNGNMIQEQKNVSHIKNDFKESITPQNTCSLKIYWGNASKPEQTESGAAAHSNQSASLLSLFS